MQPLPGPDGHAQMLNLGEQAYFSTRYPLAPNIDAALVFVGYGLNIPEKNYNDFAGLDLKNKVAVILTGSPADVPSALSAHYQSCAERWKALKAVGAIGVIQIQNPASVDLPWARSSLNRNHPSMDLLGPEFNETSGSKSPSLSIPPMPTCSCREAVTLLRSSLRWARTVNRCRTFPCRFL